VQCLCKTALTLFKGMVYSVRPYGSSGTQMFH